MTARACLSVELGVMKPQWDDWCAARGLTPAEGVRHLIATAVQRPAGGGNTVLQPDLRGAATGGPRPRLGICLTPAERTAVRERAAASGFTANRWIATLIRAQLTGEPQFGEREMVLLAASNQALATTGQLLRRIVRDRDTVPGPGGTFDWRQLAAMEEQLDAHLRAVAGLVRANIDRWSH